MGLLLAVIVVLLAIIVCAAFPALLIVVVLAVIACAIAGVLGFGIGWYRSVWPSSDVDWNKIHTESEKQLEEFKRAEHLKQVEEFRAQLPVLIREQAKVTGWSEEQIAEAIRKGFKLNFEIENGQVIMSDDKTRNMENVLHKIRQYFVGYPTRM